MSPRRQDALLAAALATALLVQLALLETEGSAALNVVGGLLLTLPLAFRRTAPVAVICVFVATAILNEALGGALFTFPEAGVPDQDPPLFASIAAGMVAFYSLGAHAEDRPATLGAVVGLVGRPVQPTSAPWDWLTSSGRRWASLRMGRRMGS